MELTGLSLGQVLGVLGGVGGLVLVLYLLKLRRRRVTVPFVKLWETVLAEKQTTRLFSQLKRWLSLLVALAIVALIAFALGDPRYAGATEDGRTLAVLVDASASMQATDVEPSRFGKAKQELEQLIEGLGPADRMLIAQMDATTRPLSPLSGERRVLREALDELEPTDVSADVRAGLRMALDVLRGEPNAEVVLLTDGGVGEAADLQKRLREAGVRVSWDKLGDAGDNVALSAFSVRRYPLDKSQSEVLVELYNPTDAARQVELTLIGDDEPVDVQKLRLGGGERLRRFFQNVSGVDSTLEARVKPADGKPDYLPADDSAYARLPERRRARVLAVTPGNLYLQAALLLDEYLDVTEVHPSEYAGGRAARGDATSTAPGTYDVVIFDGWVPPSPPDRDAIYIHPVPQSGESDRGPLEVTDVVEQPYFDELDRDHPLLRWTALGDVNLATALEVELQQGDDAVAGDEGVPLIVTGSRDDHRFVALTFDVRQSDLPLRVAWPLLLLNSVDWFVKEDQEGYLSSFRTGRTWHVPVDSELERATVIDPQGTEREVPVVEGRAVYSGQRAGFYTLRTPAGDSVFAANLGPGEESRIEPVDELRVAGLSAGTPTQGRAGLRRELWIYLVLAALGILAIEWLTYHRRWTV